MELPFWFILKALTGLDRESALLKGIADLLHEAATQMGTRWHAGHARAKPVRAPAGAAIWERAG